MGGPKRQAFSVWVRGLQGLALDPRPMSNAFSSGLASPRNRLCLVLCYLRC